MWFLLADRVIPVGDHTRGEEKKVEKFIEEQMAQDMTRNQPRSRDESEKTVYAKYCSTLCWCASEMRLKM